MKYKYIFLALALFAFSAKAQTGIGSNTSYKKEGNTLLFHNANGDVKLEFCSSTLFRVRASWTRSFEADEHLMQENYSWPAVAYKITDAKTAYVIETSDLIISIVKSPFVISVSTAKGILLSSEYLPGSKINGGFHHYGDTVTVTKDLGLDEHFFGFGERMDNIDQTHKLLNLSVGRGKSRDNLLGAYNVLEANYCPVPFFMSTRGYGIFLHNSYATSWDMGNTSANTYSFKATGGELDYYFMYGPDFPSILKSYTSITGRAPLLNKFGFGLQQGTYSGGVWGHEAETSDKYPVGLLKKMRELGIPVDILWLDSTWRLFGTVGGKGATTFEWRETFKNPKGMFDSLYANHIKMVGLHIRPRVDNANKLTLLTDAQNQGVTYPEPNGKGEFVNFFDQKAVDWWWNNGVMKVASMGAKFLKTDEGSAFGALANESDKVGPQGKVVDGLHNVFPVAYAKAPYLHFQDFNGFRGMNQTREGYAGIQRYPYIFAGDWPSEWQYFAPVVKAGINIGLSGVSDWAHCMGGFEHPADPELYIRWTQFGFFSPVALVFGFDHPGYKEPWAYGDEALANFKRYDLLRYRLIPYIYSNAFTAYQTGTPIMRALVLNNQNDPNTYDIADQYMFGSEMMVCPVTVKGAQTRSIYFPEGTWYDYWSGEKFSGKQYVHVLTPLDKLPIYVKEGAIIPMQPEMKYMDEKPVDEITLDIWPGKSSSFDMYEDDGLSLKYKGRDYAVTKITALQGKDGYQISIDKPVGKFTPPPHTYALNIHWNGRKPASVTVNGKSVNWMLNGDMLSLKTGLSNQESINIIVK
jgi:alpha-glucosidase (family GH31 glycosyl hydrolase)